jgi:hypothetical protein
MPVIGLREAGLMGGLRLARVLRHLEAPTSPPIRCLCPPVPPRQVVAARVHVSFDSAIQAPVATRMEDCAGGKNGIGGLKQWQRVS